MISASTLPKTNRTFSGKTRWVHVHSFIRQTKLWERRPGTMPLWSQTRILDISSRKLGKNHNMAYLRFQNIGKLSRRYLQEIRNLNVKLLGESTPTVTCDQVIDIWLSNKLIQEHRRVPIVNWWVTAQSGFSRRYSSITKSGNISLKLWYIEVKNPR